MIKSRFITYSAASLLLLALIHLSGCGSKDERSATTEAKKQGVIPQAQLDAMEKAKEVEEVLNEAEQQRREQLDQ